MTGQAVRLLVLIGALTVVAVIWLRLPGGDPPAAGVAPSSNLTEPMDGPIDALVVADVRLDALAGEATRRRAPARDPFRFRPAPPPPAPPPVTLPPAPRLDELPRQFVPQPPQVPPIPLRLFGVLQSPRPGEGLIGIFTGTPAGQGKAIAGKAGDVLEGRYRVLRVEPDAAEVAYLDGRGRQTLRMGQ